MNFFIFAKENFPESEILKTEMAVVREKVGEDYIPQPLNLYEVRLKK